MAVNLNSTPLLSPVAEARPTMRPDPQLTASIVSDPAALTGLRSEWQQLHTASGTDLFLSWDWLVPWWQHLAAHRELFVLLARDEHGRLRGLLALSLETARVGFRRIRRLRFIGDDQVGSDYLDAIIEPGWSQAANRAFASALLSRRSDWDLLDLRDMDQQSDTPRQLLDALGAAFDMRSVTGLSCPGQDFERGLPAADFISRTSRFKNYSRRRQWLQRQPGFRIEVCRDTHTLQPAMATFFRLHHLRWQEDGGSSGIVGARVEAFHRDAMTRLMAGGKLRLYVLWVNGLAVACVYALIHGQTFYYYQAGMDPAWRSRSVGLVLIGETFADAIRSGLTRYDFLRGEEAYKADWVDGSRQLISRRLYARGGAGARAVSAQARLLEARTLVKTWLRRAGLKTMAVCGPAHGNGSAHARSCLY